MGVPSVNAIPEKAFDEASEDLSDPGAHTDMRTHADCTSKDTQETSHSIILLPGFLAGLTKRGMKSAAARCYLREAGELGLRNGGPQSFVWRIKDDRAGMENGIDMADLHARSYSLTVDIPIHRTTWAWAACKAVDTW
jgi:hypothetical protein